MYVPGSQRGSADSSQRSALASTSIGNLSTWFADVDAVTSTSELRYLVPLTVAFQTSSVADVFSFNSSVRTREGAVRTHTAVSHRAPSFRLISWV